MTDSAPSRKVVQSMADSCVQSLKSWVQKVGVDQNQNQIRLLVFSGEHGSTIAVERAIHLPNREFTVLHVTP